MKKVRIVLSFLACVFALSVSLANLPNANEKWFLRDAVTGEPTEELLVAPSCSDFPTTTYCAGFYSTVGGEPVGSPLTGTDLRGVIED